MSALKKRKDGRLEQIIPIGFNENGKIINIWVYGRTTRELNENIARKISSMISMPIIKADIITLEKWSEIWINTYKIDIEYYTRDMYQTVLRAHILPVLGQQTLNTITVDQIQSLIGSQINIGHSRTAQKIYITLTQLFAKAWDTDRIINNPMTKIHKPRYHTPKKRALSNDEENLIISAHYNHQETALIYMLMYTGMRKGELLSLKPSDIDLKQGKIFVNKNLVLQSNRPVVKEYPKSEAGNREIPIFKPLRPVIEKYLSLINTEYLFTNSKGQLMSGSCFSHFWRHIYQSMHKAGVERTDITSHIFRHNFATNLIHSGCDINRAQAIMGHASPTVLLEIYTHFKDSISIEVEDRINNYLLNH